MPTNVRIERLTRETLGPPRKEEPPAKLPIGAAGVAILVVFLVGALVRLIG
jgi:hypothetical protein